MVTVPAPLAAHLRAQLGEWPPARGFTVTSSDRREQKGWDGRVRSVMGVVTPEGTILSVAPNAYEKVAGAEDRKQVEESLGGRLVEAVFRWTNAPADLEPIGEWRPVGDPVVPEWLRPFGGKVLMVIDGGDTYVAGVGLKRHDDQVWEISVGTEEAARGRGLARRLVSAAARAVIDDGRSPTYLHDPSNHASASVADAAGFPDLGWRMLFFVTHPSA